MAEIIRYNVHIPFDIALDILTRLPVKSLFRFKSVCKKWYALIQNTNFIEKHSIQSALNPYSLLVSYNSCSSMFNYGVLNLNGTFDDKSIDIVFYPNKNLFPYRDRFFVVGISKGIVCLSSYRNGIYCLPGLLLFNPATSQFHQLSDWLLGWHGDYLPDQFLFTGLDFGPDLNLSVVGVRRHTHKNLKVSVWAQIYNIRTRNWKNMNLKIRDVDSLVAYVATYSDLMSSYVMPIIIDGVFYWEIGRPYILYVACLDICNATYDEIEIPDTLLNFSTDNPNIIALKGELTLVHYGRSLEIWILNESERNWTKKFVINDSPISSGFYRLVGCLGNGELLVQNFATPCKIEFLSCDVNSGETKTLLVSNYGMTGKPCIYAESLLWPFD